MQPLSAEEIHAAVDRAVAFENQGFIENARTEYERLLEQLEPRAPADPTDKETRWAIARATACYAGLLFEQKEFHAALEAAESSLRARSAAAIWILAGQCHKGLGDNAKARQAFRRSADLEPRASAWVLLFSVTEGAAERRACLEKALELEPDYDEAHYNFGVELRRSNELTSARHHLERAVALDPNYALAYAELGWTLNSEAGTLDAARARELRDVAVTHLERALELDPTLFWGRLYLAITLEWLERLRDAKVQYETAVRLHPNESLPHTFYGDFLGNQYGNLALAEQHLRKGVELDPEGSGPHFHLGKFLQRRGRYIEARRHLLRAEELGRHGALAVFEED